MPTKARKAEITTTSPTSLASTRPPRGTEHITSEDVMMPRLGLAQAISPVVNKQDSEYIEGLDVGDFYNTVSSTIYGPGPLTMSVIVARPPRAVEFAALADGGGIIDAHVPLHDPRLQFGEDGSPPQATKFYDYVLWLHDSDELIAMSLARSAIKAAKSLNGLIRMRGGGAIFDGRYTVTSVQKSSSQGSYQSWRFRNSEIVGNVPEAQVQKFAALFAALQLEASAPPVVDVPF